MDKEIQNSKDGTVGNLEDDRVLVRFERPLNHPLERVWRAITEPRELAIWYPGTKFDQFAGGKFVHVFQGDCDGGPARLEGKVTVFDPPRRLVCSYQENSSIEWALKQDGAAMLLTFENIHGGGAGEADHLSILTGWHAHLDVLAGYLVHGSGMSVEQMSDHEDELLSHYQQI